MWDLLTGIGTCALAAITAVFAWPKKTRLTLYASVSGEPPESVDLRVTNESEISCVVQRCVWKAGNDNIADFPLAPAYAQLNQQITGYGSPRLIDGDVLSIGSTIDYLARQAAKTFPKIKSGGIQKALENSKFVCVTTTGKQFSIPVDSTILTLLANRTSLHAQNI